MSDTSGRMAATSLAIVEKKPQRRGGCVGIFFQLFDWNRRFAKKKLFSTKLLPPARLKKSSTKFGGDEKLPKLRLIVDENSGGFPQGKKNDGVCNVDSEQKLEMRAPGLVARLMGLESMPTVLRDKLKKASASGTVSNKGDKFVDGHSRSERQELALEKGETKKELRPQKLQKTGISDRKPVTRLGAEALELKNVLSRSRKHHKKLVSPVKSPRNHSGRNTSRLIGAATRILEPRLQRSRSKCALTYSTVAHHPPAETLMKEVSDFSVEPSENFNCLTGAVSNGQTSSCRNCGHLLDIVDFTPNIEEQPPVFSPVSKIANHSFQIGYPSPPICGPAQEKSEYQETSPFCSSFAMDNGQPHTEYVSDNKPLKREGQRQWQATTRHGKLQKDVSPSVGLNQKALGQRQMFQGMNRLPLRSRVGRQQSGRVPSAANATNETRNYVEMNRNLTNNARSRMPAKLNDCQFDADKKVGEKRHDSLSPVRKRRSMNISRLNEGHGCVSSTFVKPTSIRSNLSSGEDTGGPCTKSTLVNLQESLNNDSGKNEVDRISFTFNSPMKREAGVDAELKERRNGKGSSCEVTCKKSALLKNDGNRSSQKSFPLSGDTLGALLEQKLRELNCLEEDESAFGDTTTTPKKTTAMILQELISALTTERSCDRDDSDCKLKNRSHFCSDRRQCKMSTSIAFQAKAKSTKNSVGYLHDCEHLSPGSVLEASFSNDSCTSSSLEGSSKFCQEPHSLEPDADLLDSASSFSLVKFYRESVNTLLNNISEVLSSINLADGHLKGCKLSHAKDVILNAEMVFGNSALPGAIVDGGFSIGRFVLNELERLASVMWTNFSCSVGFDDTKEGHQLKTFVFDCVIEYLDSRFSRYSNSGFNAWTRLPLRMKTEMVIDDIVEEVRRWAELAGFFPDDLLEYEMSHSLGKWIDFELEAFETGVEIGEQILQILIDELVIDFKFCRPSSLGYPASSEQGEVSAWPFVGILN